MSHTPRPVVGIFGVGKVGIPLARLALNAGYPVRVASSRTAADTAQLARALAPGAVPDDGRDLAAHADLLILAVPLHRFRELPLTAMGERIVIDAMNYWPAVDGVLPEFEDRTRPSSTVVRDAIAPTARLVKTLNHLSYRQLEELPRPASSPERAAVGLAGDDPSAIRTVVELLDRIGFDSVLAGALAESTALEPRSPVFGQRLSEPQLRLALGIHRAA